jgi:hypothetical protein
MQRQRNRRDFFATTGAAAAALAANALAANALAADAGCDSLAEKGPHVAINQWSVGMRGATRSGRA